MKVVSVASFIGILTFISTTSAFTCGNKNKTFTKLEAGVSDYPQFPGYSKLFAYIETDILNLENVSTIFNNFPNYVLNSLTAAQDEQIAQKGIVASTQMQGMTLQNMLSQLGAALEESLQNFVQKLINKAKNMEAQGESSDNILKAGYKMVYKFVTKKKEEEIMCNVRSKFTDQQWTVIYNNFGDCFRFNNYACTQLN
ncbi:hypothetical protein FO519_006825 [Halicephalobus sp. NKZ332]|nr:hypothetical protein FO519_006825 [Halicephalobus sp. NKZ332]